MAKAQEAYERGEYERAVKLLDRVLARQPSAAEPHYQLGTIYGSPGWEDPVRALYHWSLFLELAPGDERAKLAREFRGKQILSLIGEVDSTESDSMDQVRNLARENQRLREQVERLRSDLSQRTVAGGGSVAGGGAAAGGERGASGRAASAPADRSVPETYVVRPRDTLETIAQSVYGDRSAWKQILEANRSATFSRPEQLRPGMELKIPRPGGGR